MSLGELTSAEAVRAAMDEFDRLGREPFLAKYDFGEAKRYFVRRDGQLYDSKAIFGAAFGFQHPERGPLRHDEFSGGEHQVARRLERLGFEIARSGGALEEHDALVLPQDEVDRFAETLQTAEYARDERDYKVAVHEVLSRLLASETIERPDFPELLAAFFEDQLDLNLLKLSAEQQAFVADAVASIHGLKYAFTNLCGGRLRRQQLRVDPRCRARRPRHESPARLQATCEHFGGACPAC